MGEQEKEAADGIQGFREQTPLGGPAVSTGKKKGPKKEQAEGCPPKKRGKAKKWGKKIEVGESHHGVWKYKLKPRGKVSPMKEGEKVSTRGGGQIKGCTSLKEAVHQGPGGQNDWELAVRKSEGGVLIRGK